MNTVDGELISSSESRGEMEDALETETAVTVNKYDKLLAPFPSRNLQFPSDV